MEPARGELHVHPVRWLRRLSSQSFERLMGASIESVLRQDGRCAPEAALALRRAALERFRRELLARTQRVRALTKSECLAELERTHGALLRERLEQARELGEVEHELGRVRRVHRDANGDGQGSEALLAALALELRGLVGPGREGEVDALLERERERREQARSEEARRTAERIDRLERRVAKLKRALAESEVALAELARRAQLDPGLPSVYRTTQGLAADEQRRAMKLAMLTQVFEVNRHLQRESG
jgi:hypothetical protein